MDETDEDVKTAKVFWPWPDKPDVKYTTFEDGIGIAVKDYEPWRLTMSAPEPAPIIRNADRFANLEDACHAFRTEIAAEMHTESDCSCDWTRGEVESFMRWLFSPNGDALLWFEADTVQKAVQDILQTANNMELDSKQAFGPMPSNIPALLRGAATTIEDAYKRERDKSENRLFADIAMARSEERQECADEIKELKDEVGRLERALNVVLKTVNLRGCSGSCNIPPFEVAELREIITSALDADEGEVERD